MPESGKTLGRWYEELRRRKVFRVAVAYLLGAWLLVQVADATFEPLGAPVFAQRYLILALALGFPVACMLAWVFDLTPRGVERTPPAAAPATDAIAASTVPAARATASIAVLPFVDLSPQHDQEYFCEGIAEEIVNSLCCVSGLRVASRSSAARFRGHDVREAGRALGVSAVLEGSVRKSGTRVRITAQLVDCTDGYHRWSESFDRELDDVFALQTGIARKLVAALKLTLTPQEEALLDRGGTRNAAAYDLYLRGQARMLEHTDTSLAEATALFREAIAEDARFAQAHAGLANSIALRALWGLGLPSAELEEGRHASAQALALQPNMPEAQVAIACLHSLQGREAEADAAFEAALRLNPSSYDAHYFFARHCFGSGRYERAVTLFEKAHELRPDEYQPLSMLQGVLERLGRRSEERVAGERAMRVIDERLRFEPRDARALQLGAVQAAKLGLDARARELAARARAAGTPGFSTAYNLACTYAVLGDHEAALAALDEAIVHGRGNLDWIERDPDLDTLREDPRFREWIAGLRTAHGPGA